MQMKGRHTEGYSDLFQCLWTPLDWVLRKSGVSVQKSPLYASPCICVIMTKTLFILLQQFTAGSKIILKECTWVKWHKNHWKTDLYAQSCGRALCGQYQCSQLQKKTFLKYVFYWCVWFLNGGWGWLTLVLWVMHSQQDLCGLSEHADSLLSILEMNLYRSSVCLFVWFDGG